MRWLFELAALFAHARATALYIDISGHNTPLCGSLSKPCASLVYTLEVLAQPYDIVKMAPGVYLEVSPSAIEFNATHVRDVIITSTTGRAQDVRLDRNYMGRLFDFGSGAGDVRISGLTFIRGGWLSPYPTDNTGGLMRIRGNSTNVYFENCVFDQHRLDASGVGGVGVISAGSPVFHNCVFRDSWASSAGCFLVTDDASPVFIGCIFENSGCYSGGGSGGAVQTEGSSTSTWSNCSFRNNTSDYGGALSQEDTSTGTLTNCTLVENTGRGRGGALAGFAQASTRFFGCEFTNNHIPTGSTGQDFFLTGMANASFDSCSFVAGPETTTGSDGACGTAKDFSSVRMTNSVVSGYRAAQGTLYLSSDGTSIVESTLFHSNDCVRGGGVWLGMSATIRNCTFRQNRANDGGAIYVVSSYGITVTVIDSVFENNLAWSSGGAIRSTLSEVVIVQRSQFIDNIARSHGGAIMAAHDSSSIVSASTFTGCSAIAGGAIWSEGFLTVTTSSFIGNSLIGSATTDTTCSWTGLGGAAIYSTTYALSMFVDDYDTSDTNETACVIPRLSLSNLTLTHNDAGLGSAGGIFVDQQIPSCLTSINIVCSNCTFADNVAAYGYDVATIATSVVLQNSTVPSSWQLMTPNTIVLGAKDALGQWLAGAHALVRVHMYIEPVYVDARASSVHFVGSTSLVIRSGLASFEDIMLSIRSNESNLSAQKFNLVLAGETTTGGAMAGETVPLQSMVVPITLLGCSHGLGPDGRCAVDTATGPDDKVAIIEFVCAVSTFTTIILGVWYGRTDAIMRLLRMVVTSLAATTFSLVLDVADLVSDVLVMVHLVTRDFQLNNSTFTTLAYIACFVIALVSSLMVIRMSVILLVHEWKKPNLGKQLVSRSFLPTRPSNRDQSNPRNPRRTQVTVMPVLPIASSKPPRQAVARLTQMKQRLAKQIDTHRRRGRAIKAMVVRMVAEDMVLMGMSIYLYSTNSSVEEFATSRLRIHLALAVLLSAVHLEVQAQILVVWLDAGYVHDMQERSSLFGEFLLKV